MHDTWQQVTTTISLALGLYLHVLDFCFDKCEAQISRFTVLFFFFPNKNHTYLKFSIYMKIQGGFNYFQTKKDSPAEFERNRFLDAPNRFYRDFCLKDNVSFSLKEA